jgi:cobalt-precorrin 5A hydrolase / precorrin-3B C17-methyltransferase
MTGLLPADIAIVIVGEGGATLAHRLCTALPGARLHGPRRGAGDYDVSYDRALPHIGELFASGRPILGICASGILIRSIAKLIANKREDPPVVAVAEDGSVAVPLLGGHRGANAIARAVAELTGGVAAITTAGDLRLGLALDEPPAGWRIANPDRVKPIAAALLKGEPVALVEAIPGADWLKAGSVRWATAARKQVVVTDRAAAARTDTLIYHPPILALGIGCERGCSAHEISQLARSALADAGLATDAVAAVVSIMLKRGEPGIHALAAELGVPARFFEASRLLEETPRLSERSAAAFRATGCWGVAEGAALAAAGLDGVLVVAKRKSRRATCAVTRAAAPIAVAAIGRPRGKLAIIGIGPGDPLWRTPEASTALAEATDIVGYRLYLDLLGRSISGKTQYPSAIGDEAGRVRLSFDLAAAGRSVALVSSGDAGIYGLAPLVFELLDRAENPEWHGTEIVVCPGVSALQAAAARAGAPLGHDFCAISLSDQLIPWEEIRYRLEAAAKADFVVALYNPRSARRPSHLADAARILLGYRRPDTPVFIGRNLGRCGEEQRCITLSELAEADIDMLCVVLVGNRRTRRIDGDPLRVYTPRGYLDCAPQ